ncbi:MAG: hypothetical protein HYX74_06315 [Acidobacteria bacterium]|nr:hypothetical protein [Acidobacteriota bacterium]
MKRFFFYAAISILGAGLIVGETAAQQRSGLPAPRAPKRYRVTKLEQVLPNARILVRRPFSWLIGAQYGLGLQKGEKLLISASGFEPLVVEAIAVAAGEMGVTTDVITRDMGNVMNRLGREELDYERFDPTNYLSIRGIVSRAVPDWLSSMIEDYDMVLGFQARGTHYGKIGKNLNVRSASLDWAKAEQLASPAVSYPDELLELIAMKTWQTYIRGKKVRVTDPEGTDLTFSLDQTNRERFEETRGMATYGERSLDRPIAHEVHPDTEPYLTSNPDAEGVMVTRQVGLIPLVKLYVEKGQVVRIEGGGVAGENMKAALERFKNVQFPGYYPGPGIGWLEEVALGTNPKIGPAGPIRRRSGMLHMAWGTDRYNRVSDDLPTLPSNHRDMDFFYYMTFEVDGKKLVDNGHLTVLDDPEVRKVAAKYGNPDELLREDWIPQFDEETGRVIYPPYEEDVR